MLQMMLGSLLVNEAPVGHEPADAEVMLSGGDLTAVDGPATVTCDNAEI